MWNSRRARRVAAAWIALVLAASVVDPPAVGASGGLPVVDVYALSQVDIYALSHFVAYGVFAWLLADGVDDGEGGRTRPRRIAAAAAIASAVGLGVELVQAPLAARTASAADAVVNGIGAVAGAGVRAVIRETGRIESEDNARK